MAASSSTDQVCHEFAHQESKHHLHFSTHCESKVCSQSKFTNDPNSGWSQNPIPVGHKTKIPVGLLKTENSRSEHFVSTLHIHATHEKWMWEKGFQHNEPELCAKIRNARLSTVALPVQFPLNQNPCVASVIVGAVSGSDSGSGPSCRFHRLEDDDADENDDKDAMLTWLAKIDPKICWQAVTNVTETTRFWFWSDIIVFWHYDIMTLILKFEFWH